MFSFLQNILVNEKKNYYNLVQLTFKVKEHILSAKDLLKRAPYLENSIDRIIRNINSEFYSGIKDEIKEIKENIFKYYQLKQEPPRDFFSRLNLILNELEFVGNHLEPRYLDSNLIWNLIVRDINNSPIQAYQVRSLNIVKDINDGRSIAKVHLHITSKNIRTNIQVLIDPETKNVYIRNHAENNNVTIDISKLLISKKAIKYFVPLIQKSVQSHLDKYKKNKTNDFLEVPEDLKKLPWFKLN